MSQEVTAAIFVLVPAVLALAILGVRLVVERRQRKRLEEIVYGRPEDWVGINPEIWSSGVLPSGILTSIDVADRQLNGPRS